MPNRLLVRLPYMSTLAERIKEAMNESGAIAADLARACGIRPPSVSAWLSGETKTLKAATAMRAAEFLGVNQLWLTEGKGPKRGNVNRPSATVYDPSMGSGAMLLAAADYLSRSTNVEPADQPPSSAHIQPARKATEPGAVIALSPAEHALLDAYRLMASADQEEIRRLAEEKAKRTRELLSDPRVHELLREIEQRKK